MRTRRGGRDIIRMDPFSEGSGELYSIQQAYYTGDYNQVLSLDITGYNERNKVAAQVLVERAKVRLGRAQEVVSELEGVDDVSLQAVKAYAQYTIGVGAKESGLEAVKQLVEKHGGENSVVQYLGGLVYVLEGQDDEALQLLEKHEGSLECISLIVQIHLLNNRVERASQEIQAAKKWAQDNIVFNLAEAWVDLRQDDDKYQDAYYIYQELTGGAPTAKSLVGQAVAHLQLGQIPEAEQELSEALQLEPHNKEALSNSIACSIISGKEYSDLESNLEQVQKDHPSLVDVTNKTALFDKVLEKYSKQIPA